MDKKVSVIVPVYRVGAYIHHCVDSILGQTYQNIELILVDDGGNDECPAICDSYALQDPRVVCIHKENGGQSFARRSGVEKASGEYIMFVDGDDWLEPEAVSKSLAAALEHDAGVVCFGYKRVYEARTFDTPVFPGVEAIQIWEQRDIPELRRRIIGLADAELANVEAADRMAPVWGKLYKKEVIDVGKWVSEREVGSSEDALFNLYALSACKRFVYINEFLYCYRKTNEQATTRRYRENLVQQWEILFHYFRQFIDETNAGPRGEVALNNRVCLSMIGLGLNELGNPAGFFKKAANLRSILCSEPWAGAYETLEFRYFPLKWKIFFYLCKFKQTELLLLMMFAINKLKSILQK